MKNTKPRKYLIICFISLFFIGFAGFILNLPLSLQLEIYNIEGEPIYENPYHETGTALILYDADNNCVTFLDIHTSAPFCTQKIQAYSVFDLTNRSETKAGGFYDTVGHGDREKYRYAHETGRNDNLCALGIYVAEIDDGVSSLNTLMFGVSSTEKPDCLFQERFGDVFVFAELRTP